MGNAKLIKRDPLWSTICEETDPNQLFIDINEADSITSRNDRPFTYNTGWGTRSLVRHNGLSRRCVTRLLNECNFLRCYLIKECSGCVYRNGRCASVSGSYVVPHNADTSTFSPG